jgi:hypothetical protein
MGKPPLPLYHIGLPPLPLYHMGLPPPHHRMQLIDQKEVWKLGFKPKTIKVRITKHTMIYPGLGPSLEEIAIRPAL